MGSFYALKMTNSLPPVHFEVHKVFLCVHMCALCYAGGDQLLLSQCWYLFLGTSVHLFLVLPERVASCHSGEQKGDCRSSYAELMLFESLVS